MSHYLNKYNGKLPIMDKQTFERVTNDIGKEQFRLDLADYIAKHRPEFPLKEISYDQMLKDKIHNHHSVYTHHMILEYH